MDAISYKATLARLFDNGELITYPKNQIIIYAYDQVSHLYRIEEGFVKVYTINSRGEEQIHVMLGPSDVFPLGVVLNEANANIFHQAMSDSKIARVPWEEVDNLLKSDVTMAYAALQQSVEQYRIYAARIYSLEYRFARERLAHRLLVLCGRFGWAEKRGIVLRAPLTQQMIASSINLSRETVSREMERFVAKGYLEPISRSGEPLVIKDYEGLAKEIPGPIPFVPKPAPEE